MYIKYTNAIEDYTNFQLYHCKNSPSVKRSHFIARIISSLVFIILALVGYLQEDMVLVFVGLILAVIVYFYIPYSIRKKIEKLSKKMFKEGKNKDFLCEHIFEIGNDSLTQKTELREISTQFSCVERICLTDEYAFIYIGAVEAHVVPIKRVTEGDVNEFIKELQLKCTL